MSIIRKPGRLRNPPRGRQYALAAIIAVILIAVGSGAYLYLTQGPGAHSTTSASSTGTGSTNTSSSGSSSTSKSSSSASSGTGFNNPPCTPYSTSSPTGAGKYALICTNLGLIEVQLYSSATPDTVANFISLSQSGFYNDLVWHRIVPGFVIQAGDPNTRNGGGDRSTWGTGTSGTNVKFEYNSTLSNKAGSLAMASTAAGDGGSSQFYINLVDNSQALDGKYAVFGQVINGMSVVQAIARVQANSSSQPVDPSAAYIVSITIQNNP